MKTILVTGADGFIGRRMMDAVRARGDRVIGLDRAPPGGAKAEGGRRKADCRPACSHALPESGACEYAGLRGETEAVRTQGLPAFGGAEGDQGPTLQGNRAPETRNSKPETPSGEAAWIVADITGSAPIELPVGIDAIIHLAGKAHALAEVAQDEAEYFRINTEGTRRMLEAAQRAGVRSFVLFSTVKAAGDSGSEGRGSDVGAQACCAQDQRTAMEGAASLRPYSCQSDPSNVYTCAPASVPLDELCSSPPDTPYGQSKRAAEALVLEGGYISHPVVLRPCLVYGPTPKGNLEKMITAVRRGRFPPLPEVGNKRSMVHVDDVIAAALLAAEHPAAAGQIFIVADNEPFSTRQLFEWICIAAGRRVPRWTMPLWTLKLLGRVGDGIGRLRGRRFVFDSDALAKLTGNAWYTSAKLQRELGWKPEHTLRETMPEIVGR